VNEIVPIKGETPLDSLVKPAQMTPLPPEAYASADQALRDIYEISGVNEYLRGASPEIRRTATEATIIEGASNVKTRAKLSDVERMVRRVGILIVETAKDVYPETDVDELAMFLTGGEAEQIARDAAGAEAAQLSEQGDIGGAERMLMEAPVSDVIVTPTEEIFIGEYEIDVESGSTEMRSPQFKEQKYRELATALIEYQQPLAQAGVNINLRKAMELWFEAAQIADVDGMFVSDADMAAQQPAMPEPPTEELPGQPGAGVPGMPPELAALMGASPTASPGGTPEGEPNIAATGAPQAPIDESNSGILEAVE
jgi:hypothetical protein